MGDQYFNTDGCEGQGLGCCTSQAGTHDSVTCSKICLMRSRLLVLSKKYLSFLWACSVLDMELKRGRPTMATTGVIPNAALDALAHPKIRQHLLHVLIDAAIRYTDGHRRDVFMGAHGHMGH